jgi:hypothetical protein
MKIKKFISHKFASPPPKKKSSGANEKNAQNLMIFLNIMFVTSNNIP